MENSPRSYEETARKRNQGFSNFAYFLSWVALVISGFIALLNFSALLNMKFDVVTIVMFVVFGGLAFLIWRNKDNLRIEYDYTFTAIGGGKADLDVAKVLGNSRRKLMTSLSLKSVESCGDVNHQSFQRYLSMRDVKKHNWFVNRDAKLTYFYFVKSNVKHVIVLELSDTMLGIIRPYFGYGIWQG
mgnify:CR=1 FL=1